MGSLGSRGSWKALSQVDKVGLCLYVRFEMLDERTADEEKTVIYIVWFVDDFCVRTCVRTCRGIWWTHLNQKKVKHLLHRNQAASTTGTLPGESIALVL